ncbi:MAG: 30S ribosomal protein S1, partial [Myxococcota bacterium]|nr:30S ribosomal protein S1 [Myxococcota bacterium]
MTHAAPATPTETEQLPDDFGDFAALLEEYEANHSPKEGEIVTGTVIELTKDYVTIDIGYKSEGQVALEEFVGPDGEVSVKDGDKVDVYLEEAENEHGQVVLSKEKADKLKIWDEINGAVERDELVTGTITGRVKGGLTVDIGVKAFLPGSQIDLRPVRNLDKFLGETHEFKVIKFNKKRGNIVLSRRALLERERAEIKSKTLETLEVGLTMNGIVKNITDYGAFVDLGGIDGLLHVTDMSWRRVGHPTEVVAIGQTLKVQIIRVNPETQRISLGMKQLEQDPWEGIEAKYPRHTRFKGRVTNITDYGAFVELEPGVEGLVHISEMSYTKKNVHPGKIVSTSQEVEVMVLEVDPEKRRISL